MTHMVQVAGRAHAAAGGGDAVSDGRADVHGATGHARAADTGTGGAPPHGGVHRAVEGGGFVCRHTTCMSDQNTRPRGPMAGARNASQKHLTRQMRLSLLLGLQEYINAYADCLVKANGDAESEAGKRLVCGVHLQSPMSAAACHHGDCHCSMVVDGLDTRACDATSLSGSYAHRCNSACRLAWSLRPGRSR